MKTKSNAHDEIENNNHLSNMAELSLEEQIELFAEILINQYLSNPDENVAKK
jgi:hypothetical protein